MPLITVVDQRKSSQLDDNWSWLFDMCCVSYRGSFDSYVNDYVLQSDDGDHGDGSLARSAAATAAASGPSAPPQLEPPRR